MKAGVVMIVMILAVISIILEVMYFTTLNKQFFFLYLVLFQTTYFVHFLVMRKNKETHNQNKINNLGFIINFIGFVIFMIMYYKNI